MKNNITRTVLKTLAILGAFVFFGIAGKINIAHAYLRDVVGTPTYGGWGTSYTMGHRFTPTASGNITKLWCYSSGASTVTLWSDTGTSLASTSITCSAAWVSADITPVAVTAGTYYRVTVWGGNYYSTITVPNTTTGITISGGWYGVGSNVFPTTDAGTYVYGLADVTWATNNVPPNAPTLDLPANAATNQSLTPVLKTTATDAASDYLRYKIQLCTDLAMTADCQTFDQTSSQTGWSGQNTGANTTLTNTSTGQTGTIQTWVVPSTGTYTIDAYGAQGGYGTSYTDYHGRGARMKGDFSLTAGQTLKILVGQAGSNASYGGGGGGGTFVTDSSNNPLIIAGGGGGSYGGIGDQRTSFSDATTATTGKPPSNAYNTSASSGGGGLTGNGQSHPSCGTGGTAFVNGGNGGNGYSTYCGAGGFGGGSGCEWCNYGGAGAGGGYGGGGGGVGPAGGNAGYYDNGGGGSYNGGTNQTNTAGARDGQGQVIITDSSNTAYTSGTQAVYTVQSALNPTTYYWRSYAIDPAGSNTWSSTSSIYSFNTSLKANGQACTLGSECTSTYCVDSVCCNTTCTGSTCQICNSSSNAGAGTCGYISTAIDPDSECGAIDCDGGETKYYSGWASNICYYKADVSASDAVCDGASLACQTTAVQCAASTQGASTGVTRSTCQTQVGCTGTTAGSLGNESAGSDTNNDCAPYGCTSKVYGWSGNDCKAAAAGTNDGDCNGSGACYTSFADSCTTGGSTLASCGSAGCKKASVCVQDTASTTSDTVAEICYTSGQNSCSQGYVCNATGTCIIPECTSIPTSGDHLITSACAFPGTINGVDAVGVNNTNTAKLIIGTGGSFTVLNGQTIAVGSLDLTGGIITIVDGGTIKIGTPLYIPDADNDGYPDCSNTTTQYVAGTTYLARRGATCDANDAQACPANSNPTGTCNKCVNGAIALQLNTDDFDDCTASAPGCSTTCVTTGSDGNCNGSGTCNAGGNVTAGKVCSGGSQVDATTQALACDADTNYTCTTGSCSGYYRYSECNGSGACDTAATTNYTQTTVNASAGQSLSTTCTSGANGNPGATCQKCNGSGALTVQASNEDLYSQCTLTYNGCSGACVKTASVGDLCTGSTAACAAGANANVADQKVCSGGTEIAATSGVYASIADSCSAGSCSGTRYYRACNGAGATRSDNTGAASSTIYATSGNTFTAACASSTASTCTSRTACKTNTYCNGSGSCNTPTDVGVGADTYGDCTGLDCDGGATKYYSGWTSNVCYYMADVSAANHVCDGAGACKTAAVQCNASSQGASTGVTRPTCQTQVGCTGTTAGSTGLVGSGSDTYSDCGAIDCDGEATKYYSGWASNVCYYKLDVSADNAKCNGDGTCKTQAVECTASSQGASTGVNRGLCQTQVGCTGTTAGSTGNVGSGSDTYSDCGAIDCDGGATKYYFGWVGNTCYYFLDVSAANATCNGAGACKTEADQCFSSSQGASTGVTRTACKTPLNCTGFAAGSLGNVADLSDTYNECTPYGCTSVVYGWDYATCRPRTPSQYDGNCDGWGSCYTTLNMSCTWSASVALASCGSWGCVNSSACIGLTASTTSDTVAEICYTSGIYNCTSGSCNATGTCQ